jgi:hypothetical protein
MTQLSRRLTVPVSTMGAPTWSRGFSGSVPFPVAGEGVASWGWPPAGGPVGAGIFPPAGRDAGMPDGRAVGAVWLCVAAWDGSSAVGAGAEPQPAVGSASIRTATNLYARMGLRRIAGRRRCGRDPIDVA